MFTNIHFCIDKVEEEEKKLLKKSIEKEDGSYSDVLEDNTSYLIVSRVGSRNYFGALQRNISVVPVRWVYDSIKDKVMKDLSDYTLRLFEGIVVSTTGFNNDERYVIQLELERNGGIFEGNMLYNHTDYLIVRNINSEKYRAALEWRTVTMVNEQWLRDSVHFNKLQNPVHYQNFTETVGVAQDKAAQQPTISSYAPSSETPTSFTDSCLSMIQPLENSYLTPNRTNARTREVDLLLDGYIFFVAIDNAVSKKRIVSILLSHGAFCIDTILPSTNLIIAETLTDYQAVNQLILDSPLKMDLTLIPVLNTNWVLDTHGKYEVMEYDEYRWKRGIFSNLTFFIYEFKRDYDKVKKCIESNDGKITSSMNDAVYIVCAKTVDSDVYKDDRAVAVKWLRSCTDANRLVPRNEKVLYRPFPRLLKDCVICLTGFRKEDQLTMLDYISAFGGSVEGHVREGVFALICQDQMKRNTKMEDAKKLGVPVVKRAWIDWVIVHKEMVPLEDYLYDEMTPPLDTPSQLTSTEKLYSDTTQDIQNTLSLPSKPTHSRSGSERMFMMDCRSNSLASDDKDDKGASLFGDKDKEIVYTNFNEIFNQDTVSTSQHVTDPISIEKEIQVASQQILTPKIDARPPADGNKLLSSILSTESGILRGAPHFAKGFSSQSKRINLNFSDDEKSAGSRLAVSVINDDSSEEEVIEKKQKSTKKQRQPRRTVKHK